MASDGIHGAVHAFRIVRDGASVHLLARNHRSTDGDYPCHLRLDREGRRLAVANYGSGSAALFELRPDGALGEQTALVQHSGSGPHPSRQEGPHAHATVFAPDGRFLIVADLGIDRLVVYAVDAGSLRTHSWSASAPGAGPRHLAFHPDGVHLFVVNELGNSLASYRYDAARGLLQQQQTVPTLPSDAVENTAADLLLSPSGDYVYVSNRGHNSIAVFAFDPEDGLERTAVRPCGGDWPRGFGVVPDGRHLVVANRRSGQIVVLPLLDGGADVGEPVARAAVAEPSCAVFG
jgi:6-phosphogluconolactonase